MSPLALMQEGEVAEIVDPAGNMDPQCCSAHHGYSCGHCMKISKNNSGCRNARRAHPAHGRHTHLQDMGLRPGKRVEVITNSGTGPLVLRVDECRIAMGRGAAMKIYVRRYEA